MKWGSCAAALDGSVREHVDLTVLRQRTRERLRGELAPNVNRRELKRLQNLPAVNQHGLEQEPRALIEPEFIPVSIPLSGTDEQLLCRPPGDPPGAPYGDIVEIAVERKVVVERPGKRAE